MANNELIREWKQTLRQQATDRLCDSIDCVVKYGHRGGTESPLEAMFDVANDVYNFFAGDTAIAYERQVDVVTASSARYRLDRAFVAHGAKVAVELDGHAYHERTREQVIARNTRDLDLANDGWLVVHLSWDQVFRDPLGSARMANDAAWGAVVKATPWGRK
jgi:uncharacterized protein (UPF0248 family)